MEKSRTKTRRRVLERNSGGMKRRAGGVGSLARGRGGDALANQSGEFLPRIIEVILGGNRRAKVHIDLAEPANRMEAAGLGGNQLHVRDKHRHNRNFRFLSNVINTGL